MATRFSTRAHRLRSLLVFAVFVLLVVNMLGVVDFRALVAGQLRVNTALLADLLHGNLASGLARADVIGFLATGALLTLALPNLAPLGASALTAAAMTVPFALAWYVPAPYPLVPLEYGLLAILLLFAVNVLAGYFVETHEKQKIMTLFRQYVPPALIGEIARRPGAFSLAGEARELTVLFCDVKGFTAIAETLAPHVLAEMLNHYLTAMTDVLHHHGATIDKYIGDAVMAFWGAPLAQPDHAARAVACALAMQARMRRVRKDCAARGWPELEIGVGIASGPVSVGNMG
ncbi:MAG: adenylate/guanylate cyclase domain-containing protein, partial [Gammaproteobacteria bacterium]